LTSFSSRPFGKADITLVYSFQPDDSRSQNSPASRRAKRRQKSNFIQPDCSSRIAITQPASHRAEPELFEIQEGCATAPSAVWSSLLCFFTFQRRPFALFSHTAGFPLAIRYESTYPASICTSRCLAHTDYAAFFLVMDAAESRRPFA
jgi:hypothetical protein